MANERKTLNEISGDAKALTQQPLAPGRDTRADAELDVRNKKPVPVLPKSPVAK